MEPSVAGDPLDRGDVPPVGVRDRRHARSRGPPVDQDRARAADPFAAGGFCARQPELVPNDRQQVPRRVAVELMGGTVDDDAHRR
jgi:hypothetical protein